MSGGGGLVEWVDQLAKALEDQLGGDGQAWASASAEAALPHIDFEALLRSTASEQKRFIFITARRIAMRVYVRRIGGPDLLLCAEDSEPWQLVLTMAVRAGEAAHALMCDHWGPQMPTGVRDLKNARRDRQVGEALKAGARSITDAAAVAGIPRGSFYRAMGRKPKS